MSATPGAQAGSEIDTSQPRGDHSRWKPSSERLAMGLTAGHQQEPPHRQGLGAARPAKQFGSARFLRAYVWGKVSVACRGVDRVKWLRRGRENIGDRDAVRW